MADRWVTVDNCDKCGAAANVTWSGISSAFQDAYTRVDAMEIDCPNRCHWTALELSTAYRGRSGV